MSYPPPPGGPPPPGNPYPPQGYPASQRPWPPQPPWDPSLPPKRRGNGWKWALGAVAILVVIGVTAAVTISVTKDDNGSDPTPTADTYGLASADDKGPVNIITEDPSCAAWQPINQTLADITKKGWNDRDPSIPASAWTAAQRSQYEEASQAMRDAADQTVQLVKVTPHRVVRELYEQFIAYARAYTDAIPTYTSDSNYLAGVVTSSSASLSYLCAAISYASAQARAPLVAEPSPPSNVASLTDPASPQRFLQSADPVCVEWDRLLNEYDSNAATAGWKTLDANIPASNWSAEQRATVDAVIPVMRQYADDLEALGRKADDPMFQDFAVLAAQYRRAYVEALPTYSAADSYLSRTSAVTASTIYEACKGAGG